MEAGRTSAGLSLGVDVSEKRGLDLVLLDDSPRPAAVERRVAPADFRARLEDWRPDVVAIDAPPAWGRSGASRSAERALAALAIQSFRTPSEPSRRDHPFNGWMKVGIDVHRLCQEAGYALYRGGSVRGRSLEVFPHASAVVLSGGLPPRSIPKKAWRASVLAAQGIDVRALSTLDAIDAALAALTGLLALRGESCSVGDAADGLIVLPARKQPSGPYRRCPEPARSLSQPYLPRLAPCACGDPDCREMTSAEFAPGHDAKRKSLLWERARQGEEALRELKRRGWEPPAEMRRRR